MTAKGFRAFLQKIEKTEEDRKNLFPNLLTLALKEEAELKVEGTVRVMKSGISLNIPVHYTGKHKIVF